MLQRNWWRGVFVCSIVLFVSGCVTEQAPAPAAPTPVAPAPVQQAIPTNSPFAKIREGMGFAELKSILGEPTDQETAVTGKAFNPFYYGADRVMTRLYYKGLGQIHMSGEGAGIGGGGGRVMKIEYNPEESGFRK